MVVVKNESVKKKKSTRLKCKYQLCIMCIHETVPSICKYHREKFYKICKKMSEIHTLLWKLQTYTVKNITLLNTSWDVTNCITMFITNKYNKLFYRVMFNVFIINKILLQNTIIQLFNNHTKCLYLLIWRLKVTGALKTAPLNSTSISRNNKHIGINTRNRGDSRSDRFSVNFTKVTQNIGHCCPLRVARAFSIRIEGSHVFVSCDTHYILAGDASPL